MAARRFLDIETALQWAYRDELPKRGPRGGPWARVDYPDASWMSGAASDRGDPDGPTREPGFPAASGDPHPDSLVIEAAVQDLATVAGFRFGDDAMADLTCGIPVSFDAVAIGIEAIAAMAGIVAVNARMGSRPKWSAERPKPSWVTGGNGVPKILIDAPIAGRRGAASAFKDMLGRDLVEMATYPSAATRAGVYPHGAYCPLKWRPDPARLVAERAEHCAWHAALEILAETLTGQLEQIVALPPAASWAPWRNGPEQHRGPPELFAGLCEPLQRHATREQVAALRRSAQRRSLQQSSETRGPAVTGTRPGPPKGRA